MSQKSAVTCYCFQIVYALNYSVVKINLTHFKTDISHKWDNNEFVSKYTVFRNHDILKGCGESGIKIIDAQILKRESFYNKQSNSTHTHGTVTMDYNASCTDIDCAMCMMRPWYNSILRTR